MTDQPSLSQPPQTPADLLDYLFPEPAGDVAAALSRARETLKKNPPVTFDYRPGSLGIRLQDGQQFPICASLGIPGIPQSGLEMLEDGVALHDGRGGEIRMTGLTHPSGASTLTQSPAFNITKG